MDGWIEEDNSGWKVEYMNRLKDALIVGWINGWTDGWMDERTYGWPVKWKRIIN